MRIDPFLTILTTITKKHVCHPLVRKIYADWSWPTFLWLGRGYHQESGDSGE